jgi:CheY-like chemotaxis protein
MNNEATILLVDDDENDLILLEKAFAEVEFPGRIVVLRNGDEAIQYLSGTGIFRDRSEYPWPSLMLLDLKMPAVDGFDVLAWRLKQTEMPHFPIIVFSSSTLESDIKKAMELGAAGYCAKPSDFRYLVEVAHTIREQLNSSLPMSNLGTHVFLHK